MSIACEGETQSKASTVSPSRFHWWLCGKNSSECNEVQPQGFFFPPCSFPEDNVFFTNNLAAIRSSSSSSECLTRALGVSSEGSLESNEVRLYTFLLSTFGLACAVTLPQLETSIGGCSTRLSQDG